MGSLSMILGAQGQPYSKTLNENSQPGMEAHICDPSTCEARLRIPIGSTSAWIKSEFCASLSTE